MDVIVGILDKCDSHLGWLASYGDSSIPHEVFDEV